MDILPIVFAVIIFGSAYYVCALNITQCANIENERYINNTLLDCNFSVIFCNGLDSQYCEAIDLCDPIYDCNDIMPFADGSSSSSSSPFTGSTISSTFGTTISTSQGTTTTGAPSEDVRVICRRGVTEKYKYPDNCNYYFNCLDGFLIVEQCPMEFVFNGTAKACTKRTADFAGCR